MTDHGRLDDHGHGVAPERPTILATSRAGGRLPGVPDDWYEAEMEAPHAGEAPIRLPRNRRVAAIPIRRESALVASAVAAIGGLVAVVAWYYAEVLRAYSGPWTPVAAAVVIAVPVRLFSRADPANRALASTVSYLLVLLISLMLLTHHDLVATYHWLEDYQIYEYSMVRNRLQDPLRLAVYGAGAVLAAVIPRLGARY